MLLAKLRLTNFRCFETIELTDLDRLAVFIGQNDAGKTVLLDAIELLVTNKGCASSDFRKLANDVKADEVILEGVFRLEDHDNLPGEYRVGGDRTEFRISKRFTGSTSSITVVGQGYSDPRFNTFAGAEPQKALLREFGLTPATREAERKAQREELVEAGKLGRVETELNPQFSALAQYMPRLERVSSADFQNPDAMIQQTLRAVAATVVAPVNPDTGEAKEIDSLAEVRQQIQERLNEEIDKVKATLQKIHPKIQDVRVSPTVDFTKSVTTTNLLLNTGDGDHLIDAFGEGTKKRLWMGLLEWERQARARGVSGSVIRLYDEPDVHLHYEAQRELFQNISDLSADSALRTQCFVCTHSVTLVDRAPSRSINLIRVDQDNSRSLVNIRNGEDADLARFFTDVGRAVGLSNTILLYERGFLLVEGESEAEAIPILYRKLYGRALLEDGLILINLHTCSAWKSVLQVLLANRLDMTHILLDSDCLSPESSGYMTVESLTALNCSADFLNEQVTYIGTKEYEDAFSNELIALALNDQFPLPDGAWDGDAIQEVRANATKFSDELIQKVRRTCIPQYRSNVRKPSVAAAVANRCTTPADVPNEILDALTRLRARAGIVP